MATVAEKASTVIEIAAPTVLHGVRYDEYVRLRKEPANRHLRMTYYDGTLEIMSPERIHEGPARRFGVLILFVAGELGIDYEGTGGTTFKRGKKGLKKGKGKEPDQSFYFANARRIVKRKNIDVETDPPPDLWIEVDNRSDSRGRLPVYAELGVPEVWRYDAIKNTLWFGRLGEDGTYGRIKRSVVLPMLTPALVLEALALGDGLMESEWCRRLLPWIREKFAPPPAGGR